MRLGKYSSRKSILSLIFDIAESVVVGSTFVVLCVIHDDTHFTRGGLDVNKQSEHSYGQLRSGAQLGHTLPI